MKKFICAVLALVMCLCLFTGCGAATTVNEEGQEVPGYGNFIVISENAGHVNWDYIVYDVNTKVVHYLDMNGYDGHLSPYLIYADGAIYGAIYEDETIKPAPFAMGLTQEMIESYLKDIF